MRKLSKGPIGYIERWGLGMCTHLSGSYLALRMLEIQNLPEEEYLELKRVFELFERNIDMDKKWFIKLTLQGIK